MPQVKKEIEVGRIPMALWGKDHWSTLAYIETRIVDCKGVPDRDHMRCDADRHPGLTGRSPVHYGVSDEKYPTRLNNKTEVNDHDDWDCVEDMIAEDLLKWKGTGIYPVFVLTKRGQAVCAALRVHKQEGRNFGGFVYVEAS